MIQWDIARHDVASSFTGGKLDLIVPPQRLKRLRLNQRELVIRRRLVERAQLQGVAVTLKSRARNRRRLTNRLRRPLGGGSNVNRFHSPVPHREPPTTNDRRLTTTPSFRRQRSTLPAHPWPR